MIATKSRYLGSLLGLAVGDVLGTTVEFMPPGTFPSLTDIVGGGPFDLKKRPVSGGSSLVFDHFVRNVKRKV